MIRAENRRVSRYCGGMKSELLRLRRLTRGRWLNVGLMVTLFMVLLVGCDTLFDGEDAGDGGDDAGGPPQASTSVTDGSGNTYSVGYDQVAPNDQDPVVEKRDPDGDRVWRIRHDRTPADARALYVALDDQDRPYVVFTIDGGSNEGDRFQANRVEAGAFGDAPFPSYGPGGGAKVTVLARLNATTGEIERGTFLPARLSNGNANTLRPTALAADGGSVRVDVESAAWPPAAGASSTDWERFDPTVFNNETRPPLRYTLTADLSDISAVEVIQ